MKDSNGDSWVYSQRIELNGSWTTGVTWWLVSLRWPCMTLSDTRPSSISWIKLKWPRWHAQGTWLKGYANRKLKMIGSVIQHSVSFIDLNIWYHSMMKYLKELSGNVRKPNWIYWPLDKWLRKVRLIVLQDGTRRANQQKTTASCLVTHLVQLVCRRVSNWLTKWSLCAAKTT